MTCLYPCNVARETTASNTIETIKVLKNFFILLLFSFKIVNTEYLPNPDSYPAWHIKNLYYFEFLFTMIKQFRSLNKSANVFLKLNK